MLSELGYVEIHSIIIERRFAEGKLDQLALLAADLVGQNVDLIVAAGGEPSGTSRVFSGTWTRPAETALPGWAYRTRTQKCRRKMFCWLSRSTPSTCRSTRSPSEACDRHLHPHRPALPRTRPQRVSGAPVLTNPLPRALHRGSG